jgi:hypothetical protein
MRALGPLTGDNNVIRRSSILTLDAASDGLPLFLVKTSVIGIGAALLLHIAARSIAAQLVGYLPGLPQERGKGVIDWLLVVGAAPLLESSLANLCCLFAFRNFPEHLLAAAVVIGVAAGLLHALIAPFWFFGPAASFFAWSFAWFKWRSARRSRSFLVLLIPHMLQNAVGMSLMP